MQGTPCLYPLAFVKWCTVLSQIYSNHSFHIWLIFQGHILGMNVHICEDEIFSFCLNPYIRRTKFLKVLNKRIIFECRQAFTMTDNLSSLALLEMLYLPKCLLATDGPIGCTMSNTWYQIAWHKNDNAHPQTHPMIWCLNTVCEPSVTLCQASGVDQVHWAPGGVEGFIWVLGQLILFSVPVRWWIIGPYMHGLIINSLVFHRKDLCEAKHETQSVFKFSDVLFALSQMYPPVETSHDQVW